MKFLYGSNTLPNVDAGLFMLVTQDPKMLRSDKQIKLMYMYNKIIYK